MKFNIFILLPCSISFFSNNISGYELAELLDQKLNSLVQKQEIAMTLINLKKIESKA